MARYATWADVKWWLDKDPGLNYSEPDTAILQGFEDAQEDIFENEVRGYMAVPIDRSASPAAFGQAKSVCAMRGAAQAVRYFRQTEGEATGMWWSEWLEGQADKLIGQMKTAAQQPDDIEVSADPVQVIPMFGGLPATGTFQRRTTAATATTVEDVDTETNDHVW